jgi:hypothetical protein
MVTGEHILTSIFVEIAFIEPVRDARENEIKIRQNRQRQLEAYGQLFKSFSEKGFSLVPTTLSNRPSFLN